MSIDQQHLNLESDIQQLHHHPFNLHLTNNTLTQSSPANMQPAGLHLLSTDLSDLDMHNHWSSSSPSTNPLSSTTNMVVDSLSCSTVNLAMRNRGQSLSDLSSPALKHHNLLLQHTPVDLSNLFLSNQQQPFAPMNSFHSLFLNHNNNNTSATTTTTNNNNNNALTPETPMIDQNMSTLPTPNSINMESPALNEQCYSFNPQSKSKCDSSVNSPTNFEPRSIGGPNSNDQHLSITIPKRRPRATPEQLRILEETFLQGTSPNAQLRAELAARLNMTERSVQIWFQNKRAKTKHSQRNSQLDIQGLSASTVTTPARANMYQSPSAANLSFNDDWITPASASMMSASHEFATPITDINTAELAAGLDLMDLYLFTVDSLIIGTWRRAAQYSSRSLYCAFSLKQRLFTWTITDKGHTFKMEIEFDHIQQLVLQRVPLPPPSTVGNVPPSPTTQSMVQQAVAVASANNPPQAELLLTISEHPKFWMYMDSGSGTKSWTPCYDFTENRQAERYLQHKLRGCMDQLRTQVLNLIHADAGLRDQSLIEDLQLSQDQPPLQLVPAAQSLLGNDGSTLPPTSMDYSNRDTAGPLPQALGMMSNRPRRAVSAPMPPSFRLKQPILDLASYAVSPLACVSPFMAMPNQQSMPLIEGPYSPFVFNNQQQLPNGSTMNVPPTDMDQLCGVGTTQFDCSTTPSFASTPAAYHGTQTFPSQIDQYSMRTSPCTALMDHQKLVPQHGNASGGDSSFNCLFGPAATGANMEMIELQNAYPSSVASIFNPGQLSNPFMNIAEAAEADAYQHPNHLVNNVFHQQLQSGIHLGSAYAHEPVPAQEWFGPYVQP